MHSQIQSSTYHRLHPASICLLFVLIFVLAQPTAVDSKFAPSKYVAMIPETVTTTERPTRNHVVHAHRQVDPSSIAAIGNDVLLTSYGSKAAPSSQQTSGWASAIGHLVKRAIAPATSYTRLVSRYQRWYRQYSALRRSAGFQMKEPLDVFKAEYSRADSRLTSRLCGQKLKAEKAKIDASGAKNSDKAGQDDNQKDDNQKEAQQVIALRADEVNMDLIMHALTQTIDVLEAQLNDAKRLDGSNHMVEYAVGSDDYTDPAQAEEAMTKLKQTAINTAKSFTNNRLVQIAKNAAVEAVANQVISQVGQMIGADTSSYLGPLLKLMGMPNKSYAVNILMSLEMRSALALANPEGLYKCKLPATM